MTRMKSNSISYKHRSTIRKLCRFLPIKKFLFFSLYWYKIYFCQICSDCCQKLYHITRAGVWLKNFNFAQMRSSHPNVTKVSKICHVSLYYDGILFFFRDWNFWILTFTECVEVEKILGSQIIISFLMCSLRFFLSFLCIFFYHFTQYFLKAI